MNEKQPTMELARFASELRFKDLPEAVVGHSKNLILDAIGDALFGTTTLWGRQAIGLAKELGGPDEATIWGDGARVGLIVAPIANGTLVHAFELEDGTRYSNDVDYPPGDPENPLSQAQLEEKFCKLSAGVLDERKVRQIIAMVHDLENIQHIDRLTALLCP
jgi:2-methylcitrate dehydratase PrpD